MAIDFPNSPTNGDVFTSNGRSWSYDSGVWSLISSQIVVTDFGTIVDAKGDLLVGTANDVVNRLPAGTNEHRLVADSAQTTGLKYVADTTNYVVSAKGDLIVATAADTVARLPVGTNGHALVADSAQTEGVKWAAVGDVTLTGTQTLTNKTLTSPTVDTPTINGGTADEIVMISPEERWTVSATAAVGTINVDVKTSSAFYYTSDATWNWTFNFRGDSSTTLNSMLSVGDSVTVAFAVTQGSTTAYYPTTFQVDGSTVTQKWQSGSAPTSGNLSSVNCYVFTIIKTAATPTYTVFASDTMFR